MNKLLQYFKSGKGRGLKLVFWITLLWSIAFGGAMYYVGQQVLKTPVIADFVNSIPTFVVKDGVIQSNNIQWHSTLPLTPLSVSIDTTKDGLSLPVPDGLYLTRTHLFFVSERGTQIEKTSLSGNQLINPSVVSDALNLFVISFAIATFLVFFITSWLAYLISVALTALLGWAIRAALAPKRVWRVAAVTWVCGFSLFIILSLFGIAGSTWVVALVATIVNLVILKKLTD